MAPACSSRCRTSSSQEAAEESSHRPAGSRATTAAASCSCRAIRRCAVASRSVSSRSSSPRANRPRLAHGADEQHDARRDREVRRAVHAPSVRRPCAWSSPTSCRVRAQALCDPQARLHRDSHLHDGRRGGVVRREPVASHARLQGHAADRSSSRSTSSDLTNPAMETALALVHSRFSTNTFPSWDRAASVPLSSRTTARSTRCAATRTGCTRARRCSRPKQFEDIQKILPIINPNGSDSAMFDNTLELLVLRGTLAPARRDDDDSRAVVESHDDGRQHAARSTSTTLR